MSLPFSLTSLPKESQPWGPPLSNPPLLLLSDVPYAPYSKSDKLGKAADWATEATTTKEQPSRGARNNRDPFHAYGTLAALLFAAEEVETDAGDFLVVDLKALQTKAPVVLKRSGGGVAGVRGSSAAGSRGSTGPARVAPVLVPDTRRPALYGGQWGRQNEKARVRESLVKVGELWKVVYDVEFNKLNKLNVEVKDAGVDLKLYGTVPYYNRAVEKPFANAPLKRQERHTARPRALEDPVLQQLAQSHAGHIYTTDRCLAVLMLATRLVYLWDLTFVKKDDGAIFIDLRPNTVVDRESVDENAYDPPLDATDNDINNATNLAVEATLVNENLQAQVSDGRTKPLPHGPAPFAGDEALPKGYKYRLFKIPDGVSQARRRRGLLQYDDEEEEEIPHTDLVVRTEVDAVQPTGETLAVRALTEPVPTTSHEAQLHLSWKTKLATQKGAITAAELKKNNNKVSKWTTAAILAGVDTLKLGFVSRTNPKSAQAHSVLAVDLYKPVQLALQIGLNLNQGWGILKLFVDIVNANVPEGEVGDKTFVLVKHPNAAKLTLYRTD